MAPQKLKKKRRTALYYASNPEARRKKAEYDTAYHSTPERRKYRARLAAERRARGIDGKGGNDVSHTKDGGFTTEHPSTNRARNGHGKNGRLAPSRRKRYARKR